QAAVDARRELPSGGTGNGHRQSSLSPTRLGPAILRWFLFADEGAAPPPIPRWLEPHMSHDPPNVFLVPRPGASSSPLTHLPPRRAGPRGRTAPLGPPGPVRSQPRRRGRARRPPGRPPPGGLLPPSAGRPGHGGGAGAAFKRAPARQRPRGARRLPLPPPVPGP